MAMADANKRINLTAPLLSVRRHGGGGGDETAATSEPPGHTSAVVPFGWEHRPGHPKSVRTRRPPPPPPPPAAAAASAPPPPLPIVIDVDEPSHVTRNPPPLAAVAVASERARRCSDALSRDDDVISFVTVNCSATGLSDAASSACATGRPGPMMPCARGSGSVMMDRFLPAAHAVAAAGSPHTTFRKAAASGRAAVVLSGARTAGGGGDRAPAQRRVPLQHIAAYHHLPPLSSTGKNNDDDDANSDAHSTAGFTANRCGLLSARCVKSVLLLSGIARRGAGTPFQSGGGGGAGQREKKPLLLRLRSRNGQQRRLPHTGDDHDGMVSQQSWEEVYVKSLLRSSGPGGGGLMGMGPAAAVASELDRTVRELYKRRDGGQAAVRPKASHLGLLLVLDRSNEASCGHVSPARKKLSRTGDTAVLLKATATKSSPDGEKELGRDAAGGGGEYGFPLLLEDKEAVAGREMALSPQLRLSLPLPKSPTESWLSRALPSVSIRPPATSFLGLHVQPKKRAASPWCSIDSNRDVHHQDRQRQIRVHDLQK